MDEPTINIGVGDWLDEYMHEELDLSDAKKMVDACIRHKLHPAKMARLATIARWRDETDAEFWPAPKPQLQIGGASFWSRYVGELTATATMPNGKERKVRRFVAPVPEDKPEEAAGDGDEYEAEAPAQKDDRYLVEFRDAEATARALDYLLRKVPGYICGRLEIIAAAEGSKGLLEAAEMVHDKIDEIVAQMVNGD